MPDESLQEAGQQGQILRIERFEHHFLDPLDGRLPVRQHRPSSLGELHRVRPPVLWMSGAPDEPELLELVDQSDHRVAVDAEPVCQFLLAAAVGLGEVGEDAEVGGMQAEWGELRDEALGDGEPQLGQQEEAAVVESHGGTLAQFDDCHLM